MAFEVVEESEGAGPAAERAAKEIPERPENPAQLGLDVFYRDALAKRVFCAKVVGLNQNPKLATVVAWPDDGQPTISIVDCPYDPNLAEKTWCLASDPGARTARHGA